MRLINFKGGHKCHFIITMIIGLLFAMPAWATFYNAGIYVDKTSAKYGEKVTLNGAIKSDVTKKGVVVTISLNRVSEQGVISADSVFQKVYLNQTFTVNKGGSYAPTYTIPESIVSGRYAMVMKVGSVAGASEYLLAQGLAGNWTINITGKAVASDPIVTNTGIWIPDSNNKAGSAIVIHNSLQTNTNATLNVRMEIRSVSAAGVVSSSALVAKDLPNESFLANVQKSYDVSYNIPANAPGGKYILAVLVSSTAGKNLLTYSEVNSINSFTVTPVVVLPPAEPVFSLTGIYAPVSTVKAGESISINVGLKASADTSGIHVKTEIKKVSAAGIVSTTVLLSQEAASETFTANMAKNYSPAFLIPLAAEGGKYILALTVSNASGKVLLTYSEVANVNSFTVTAAPVAVDTNISLTGIYIPAPQVNSGSSVVASSGLVSSKTVSGLKVRAEVRKVSLGGVGSAAVVAFQEFINQNFVANTEKVYSLSLAIPASSESGSYILAVFVTDSSGKQLFGFSDSSTYNSFTVNNQSSTSPASKYVRGTNIMDMGIGDVFPGTFDTNYTKPSLQSLQALKDRGLQVVRLPIKWERAQTSLGGPLNPVYMGYVLQMLKDCKTVGLLAILDMHNYARYSINGSEQAFGTPNGPTRAQYADAWAKIATAVKANADAYAALYAYDIMNEPYNLPGNTGMTESQVWETYAQAAVTGIRNTNDNKMIHIEGYQFSAPHRWATLHPSPFITDPANNIMYHAHLYMDNDTSGSYNNSFSAEESNAISQGYASVSARAIANLKIFADWCSKFNQKCFLGEFGWPNSSFVGEANAQKWNVAGDEFMSYMDSIKMGGTMWSSGTWLDANTNILNNYLFPQSNTGRVMTPLNQAYVLENHLGEP